jgi:hypothetical protein
VDKSPVCCDSECDSEPQLNLPVDGKDFAFDFVGRGRDFAARSRFCLGDHVRGGTGAGMSSVVVLAVFGHQRLREVSVREILH